MKITWKEGKESLSAEGTQEQLASHIAYLEALGIEVTETKKEVAKNVDSQDVSK